MAKIRVGKSAPDVALMTLEDRPINLSESWSNGRNVLIIFLRHLA